jgi:ADP-ribose pyrophosphatase
MSNNPAMMSGSEHGPWRVLATQEIYRDPWVWLTKDDVIRPDGRPGTHTITRFKEGVSVLPLDDDGFVFLTEEFHYAQGRRGIEVISGGVETGEDLPTAAARELREEVGIVASRWTPLGVVDPLTSQAIAPMTMFLVEGLSFVEASPDGTESIRRLRIPFAEAVEMVMRSEITHSGSCVLILKTARLLERR